MYLFPYLPVSLLGFIPVHSTTLRTPLPSLNLAQPSATLLSGYKKGQTHQIWVFDSEVTLGHKFFQISEAEPKPKIPADTHSIMISASKCRPLNSAESVSLHARLSDRINRLCNTSIDSTAPATCGGITWSKKMGVGEVLVGSAAYRINRL